MSKRRYAVRGHNELPRDTRCTSCGKTSLRSRKRAEQVAGKLRLHLYECPFGNGFHLGHPPQRRAYRSDGKPSRPDVFTGSMDELRQLAQQLRDQDQEEPP